MSRKLAKTAAHTTLAFITWAALFTPAAAVDYKVLHVFAGAPGNDGQYPVASLISVGGLLYGTTEEGGSSVTGCHPGDPVYVNGCGTVFSITPSGTETILHSFLDTPDGDAPVASLLYAGGSLYGTTQIGGIPSKNRSIYENGTVFALAPDGAESVLYHFKGEPDGSNPYSSLTSVNGTLYGTTWAGGSFNTGTVFALAPDGTETVLHSFADGRDGFEPSSLINVRGVLYGTTRSGGNGHCPGGCGLVFSITTAGVYTVIFQFPGVSKGADPAGGLLLVGNQLYGTTVVGGPADAGTVFSMTLDGRMTGLYSFNGINGANPFGSLINVGGTLYGTTYKGGSGTTCFLCGTVFSITPKGVFTVLHSFLGGSDGQGPQGALVEVGGVLYGTTDYGGNTGCEFGDGCGTVFAIKP